MPSKEDLAEQKRQAWITSLKLLSATSKSCAELTKRLLEKGYPQELVDDVLNKLQQQGLINDRKLADAISLKFQDAKPSGKRKIALELKKRGISTQTAEQILTELSPEEELERAVLVGSKKAEQLKRLNKKDLQKKTFDFLCRRGFDAGTTFKALKKIFREGISEF